MNEEIQFEKWGSISRLFRPILITEKIDGTNAQVNVIPDEWVDSDSGPIIEAHGIPVDTEYCKGYLLAGSRKRYVNKQDDNYGFANWVSDNANELTKLGYGRHYGEWWGQKIQRNYGLQERRFSLFNVMRYALDPSLIPKCCHVVPLMYAGEFGTGMVQLQLDRLIMEGSLAAPGYMNPEGIVVFHTHGKVLFKYTCNGDQHKSQVMEEKMLTLQEVIK
jgi:hypothetical protein